MSEANQVNTMHDYKSLDFKCGIEIHQQLDGKKLFCSCPCNIEKGLPTLTTKRRLKASAGETGKVDQAASYEQQKSKFFQYNSYQQSTCLVELDEEPPHELNKDALETCVKVCKLMNAKINDYIQFMRKVVVDGSNVTGFQRTALVARDAHITLKSKKIIRIPTILLEEEASQAVQRNNDHDEYNISRQGIPLIEIGTAPDISTPEEAKEAAAKIGMLLRSVGVKRGIGTIRQDVNISIKGGARVEVKGFQEYKSIPKVIEYEVGRHLDLLKEGKQPQPEVRKATPDFKTEYLRPMPGASRMYPETDIPIVRVRHENIEAIKTLEEKESEIITQLKLRHDQAKEIIKQDIQFKELTQKYTNIEPRLLADIILNMPKEIKKRYGKDIDILNHHELLEKLNAREIQKEAVMEILVEIAKGKQPDYKKYKPIDESDIEQIVKKTISDNPGAPIGSIMGQVMAKLRGKADGKTIMAIVKKHI